MRGDISCEMVPPRSPLEWGGMLRFVGVANQTALHLLIEAIGASVFRLNAHWRAGIAKRQGQCHRGHTPDGTVRPFGIVVST